MRCGAVRLVVWINDPSGSGVGLWGSLIRSEACGAHGGVAALEGSINDTRRRITGHSPPTPGIVTVT